MDRSAEVQTIMQIMSNQDIQIEYAKENAVEELKVDINVEFHNGKKVEEQVEESEEVGVQEEVAVPCTESEEVIDNSGVMTQENAIFGKKG